MLTRLKVEGFKSLLDVDIHFGPFTCIAGMNAVGKSNLFDAIRFLHLLTRHPIMEAVKLLRETKGRSPDPRSLFTAFEGFRATEMRFTAEMIVGREVEDELGVASTAQISTLHYSLAFKLAEDDESRLELLHESLKPIKVSEANKALGFTTSREFRETAIQGVRRGGPFIDTSPRTREITVHQEGHGGRKIPAPRSSRTVVGGSASSDFPTVLAAHREMQSWKTLLLEPSAMRAPSFYGDERFIDQRGANLPAALQRLSRAEEIPDKTCADLANRLASLLEDVREIRVRDDPKTETLTVELRGRDNVFHPARALSDGTLRFLVLATLSLDPETRGVICLEEPENGIHPERINAMVQLLKDIALDPQEQLGPDNPLRQVIINTHSPVVFKNINRNDLVFLESVEAARADARGKVTLARVPDNTWRARLASAESLTLSPGKLSPYLGKQGSFEFMNEPQAQQ
ncbi:MULTISPECIES: AAA family ATPase [Myxococcus]|uniref:AAA family ATPase n=1 Tax=Myxococcus TaxID=32 RepID=UPI0011432487|nr:MULTISPECIES: AAA family ATPase [Myxococcus]MCK8497845.1 AAA family ATPase [Myxococcus fulvus]